MKPGFALLLSQDGLVLCHRSDDGWLRVGSVGLDAADIAGDLSALRQDAEAIRTAQGLGPFLTKLVLPNSEILYDSLDVSGVAQADLDDAIRSKLDGRTPYALDDLSYDYVVSGDTAQVAVVARETVAEAEAFAAEYGFNPVCFAAIPPKDAFAGEAMFGTTKAALALLDDGTALDRDMAPVVIVGDVATDGPVETPDAADNAGNADDAVEHVEAAEEPVEPVDDVAEATELSTPEPEPEPEKADAEVAEAAIPDAKLAQAAVAASTLSAPAAAAPRSKPLGLILTLALLAVLLVVGVLAVVLEDSETASAPQPPQTEVAALEASPAEGVQNVGISPRDLVSDPGALTPPTTPVLGPAAQLAQDAPATDTRALPPVTAMAEEPDAVPTPRDPTAQRFVNAATPEELAEGEEAAPPAPPDPSTLVASPRLVLTDQQAILSPPFAGPPAVFSERPGLLTTETRFAATGVWQRSPDPLWQVVPNDLEDLYIASLDEDVAIEDALALPLYRFARDLRPITPRPPVAPGQIFELDAGGFVAATPEGALTPEGVLVFTGAAERPAPRPVVTPATTDEALEIAALAGLRPPARPDNLVELQERATLGGRSLSELSDVAPSARPPSAQDLALAEDDGAAEANAMASSLVPTSRPAGFAERVASLRAQQAPAEPNAPRGNAPAASLAAVATPSRPSSAAPTIPTTASVARQATIENALRLNRLSLIGVYGTPSDRRALVRLASGRYVKIEVGDRIDGGRVAAIGEASVQYTKGGRNVTLNMPNS